MIKYDEVDKNGSGAAEKSSNKSKNCQKSKNLKDLKSRKGHRFGRTFTKAPILCHLDTKNLSFRLNSDSFSGYFCWA